MKTRLSTLAVLAAAAAWVAPFTRAATHAADPTERHIESARLARDAKQFDTAAAHYAAAARRDPLSRNTYLGAAVVDAERGFPRAAQARLQAVAARWRNDVDYWMALGYVQRLGNQPLDAIEAYRRALQLAPDRTDTRYELVAALQQAGRPKTALRHAHRWNLQLPEDQRSALRQDIVAAQIRRGQMKHPPSTLSALQALGAGTPGTLPPLDLDQVAGQRRAFDLLVALRDAGRANDAVTLFTRIEAARLTIPAYVLLAAADAHLTLRHPEDGEALYRRVNAMDPANPQARIGLFYALVEQERFGEALAIIDATLHDTQRAARGEFGARSAGSPVDVAITAAMGRAYAEQLPTAQRRLEALPGQDTPAVAAAEGTIYRWRGWPRQALTRYNVALAGASQQVDPAVGRIGALLDLDRDVEAETALAALAASSSAHPTVRAAARDIALRRRPQLTLDVSRGRSSGSTFGSREFSAHSALYGTPLTAHLRPVLTALKQQARFPEGRGVIERAGVGLDYRHDGWRIRTDATAGWRDNDRAGFALEVGRWLDDHVWLGGGGEYNSAAIPLRGQRAGVRGNQLQLNSQYRWHERRRAGLTYTIGDYNDGNLRQTISAFAEQRVFTTPSYRLDARVDLYSSRNRDTRVAYYSPRRDFAADVTLENRWRNWRRYENSFEQRLALTGGSYHSTGHGSAGVWNVLYGHRWRLGPKLSLGYDVSHGRHVYDGAPERETRATLSLDLRF